MIGIMFAAALTASDIEFCKGLETVAIKVSGAYQQGVSVTDIYGITNNLSENDKIIYQAVITDAVSGPRFSSPEMQEKASIDVAAKISKYCISEMSK